MILNKIIIRLIGVSLFFVLWQNSAGQNFDALPWKMNTAYFNYLMRNVHQQYEERESRIEEAFETKESMEAYRDDCLRRYKSIYGTIPAKEDLSAQMLGKTVSDGFVVEKIIYQSIPKRYVTANLYLPVGEGPFPAAVQLCGHGLGGKIPASAAAVLMAKNGIATLVVDPVGQGERIQFIDENSKTKTRGATTGHTLLNAGANLLGTSVAAYEMWDNHRAIDYLISRSDIDSSRIGVFGSSGGGTQTSYLLGFDSRIKVASICSYFSKRERTFELYGASDGCQHMPYEGKEQLEIADFVLTMAPRPVLIMSGKYDFVDYWGACAGFEELKKAYFVLGKPEQVEMFSIEGGHGMPKAKREALVSWFKRWLLNDTIPVKEGQLSAIDPIDLQCTETGQVISSISDNQSFPEYHLQKAHALQVQRNKFLKQEANEVKKQVLELLGINPPTEPVKVHERGVIQKRTYNIKKYQIARQGQMPVAVALVEPETVNPELPILIYLDENGKNGFLNQATTIEGYANKGQVVIAADLRGFGETMDPPELNDTKYWNWEYRNAMISMHIGKPIIGQRVIDIFSLLDFIRSSKKLDGQPIKVIATGKYGPAAVHAAYLDKRIAKLEVNRSIKSYFEYLENPLQRDVYSNVIYSVLAYYDLKDLVQLAGVDRVKFVD